LLRSYGGQIWQTNEKFYDDQKKWWTVYPHCIKMIVGDLNAKVGKETIGPKLGRTAYMRHTIIMGLGRLIQFSTSKNLQ